MTNKTAKKEPVKRLYLIAVILMIVGIAKFPWGQGASLDPMQLVISFLLTTASVAFVIRGRRNKREAQ